MTKSCFSSPAVLLALLSLLQVNAGAEGNSAKRAVPRSWNDYAQGFALTPGGRVFVEMLHANGETRLPELYELDRTTNQWAK